MNWRTVSLAQTTPTPWKNGGGTTRVLATWPDADNWRWRLSVAQVAGDGPFSSFPGVTRWFAVLGGAGVVLNVAGVSHAMTRDSPPLRFDGAAHTECRLMDGPTQDFNLMLRSPRQKANMQWLSGASSFNLEPGDSFALYALTDDAAITRGGQDQRVPAETLVWRNAGQQESVRVASQRALIIHISGETPA